MIDHQDYVAACERLRRLASGEIYRHFSIDKATVYDAEHDDTPATVEWLESVGLKFAITTGFAIYGRSASPHDHLKRACVGPFEIWDHKQEIVIRATGWHKRNPTRGDVLTLLRVFQERKV